MKKSVLLMSAMTGILAFSAFAGPLEKYVPNSADIVGEVKLGEIYALPAVKEMSAHDQDAAAQLAKFEAVLAKYNLKANEVVSNLMFAGKLGEEKFVVYADTQIKEADLPALLADLAAEADETVTVTTKEINGRKYYVPIAKEDGEAEAEEAEIALSYVAPGIVLIEAADELDAGNALLSDPAGSNALYKQLDPAMLGAFAANLQSLNQPGANANPDMPQMVIVNFNMTGDQQKDLYLGGKASFAKPEQQQQIAMQAQMMLPAFIGMAFGNNAELGMKLAQCLKIANGDMLSIELNVPAALLTEIAAYAEKQAQQKPEVEIMEDDVEDTVEVDDSAAKLDKDVTAAK